MPKRKRHQNFLTKIDKSRKKQKLVELSNNYNQNTINHPERTNKRKTNKNISKKNDDFQK